MKRSTIAKKGLYTGMAAGLGLFAVIGLLPGSFIGGVIGLNIAGSLFGTPIGSGVLPRLMVGVSMATGVLLSGMIFIAGASSLGWAAGTMVDAIRQRGKVTLEAVAVRVK